MSATKTNSKKRGSGALLAKSDQKPKFTDDLDLDLSSDLKGIMSALQQIRDKAQKDGQKKSEETISSVSGELRSKIDDLKSKLDKERQTLAKGLSKSTKECDNRLKNEATKLQEIYDRFYKDKESHMLALKDAISKFDEEKGKMFTRFEQLRKKEKNMIAEQEKFCADKIAQLEESLTKKKKDDKTFSILRKSLGSFLDNGSDEEFPTD